VYVLTGYFGSNISESSNYAFPAQRMYWIAITLDERKNGEIRMTALKIHSYKTY
jgi:hypothetical protein